jgi:NAD(P)-dependent dehydrogenase (short-subunit alcohol dehydrogenase family)
MDTQTKVVIVTGASAGIGKATTHTLLRQGYTVYAAARRLEAMDDLKAAGAHVLYLDLTDSDSIDHCVATVIQQSGRIDILINNAGYGAYGSVEDMPLAEGRRQFEVNMFGAVALIQRALPHMRAQRSGTIVNVTSVGGKIWSLFGAWYQATKFAMEGFSDCLRNEVRPFGINVVVVEPGAIKTEWGLTAVEHLRNISSTGAYKQLAERAARFYLTTEQERGVEPEVIARTIVAAVRSPNPKPRYVAPFAAQVGIFVRWALSDQAFDSLMGRVFGIPKRL